jgi:hypothetical protein
MRDPASRELPEAGHRPVGKYKAVQNSLRYTRFRERAEIAHQITDIYLDVLSVIRDTHI